MLKIYIQNILRIDGRTTFLIEENKISDFLNHIGGVSAHFQHICLNYFEAYKTIDYLSYNIKLGFIYMPNWNTYAYSPTGCIILNNHFHHIDIRFNWLCRECNYHIKGLVILPTYYHQPMFYDESILYSSRKSKQDTLYLLNQDFPPSFCPQCGKPLHCRPIFIEA